MKTALIQISEWDMINPGKDRPQPLADGAWLKKLVEDALVPDENACVPDETWGCQARKKLGRLRGTLMGFRDEIDEIIAQSAQPQFCGEYEEEIIEEEIIEDGHADRCELIPPSKAPPVDATGYTEGERSAFRDGWLHGHHDRGVGQRTIDQAEHDWSTAHLDEPCPEGALHKDINDPSPYGSCWMKSISAARNWSNEEKQLVKAMGRYIEEHKASFDAFRAESMFDEPDQWPNCIFGQCPDPHTAVSDFCEKHIDLSVRMMENEKWELEQCLRRYVIVHGSELGKHSCKECKAEWDDNEMHNSNCQLSPRLKYND